MKTGENTISLPRSNSDSTQRLQVPTVQTVPSPLVLLGEPLGELEHSSSGGLEPWERGEPIVTPDRLAVAQKQAPAPSADSLEARTRIRLQTAPGESRVKPQAPPGPLANAWSTVTRGVQYAMGVLVYPIYSGVVVKDLAPFYQQFSALIRAGLPLYQVLASLEQNTPNRKLREMARLARARVQEGGRVSEVFAAHPWIFPPLHIEMLRAAEEGGLLESTLKDLSNYVEQEIAIRRLMSRETLYPKLVLVVAALIMGKPGFSGGTPAVAQLVLGSMGKLPYTLTNYLNDTLWFGLTAIAPLVAFFVLFRLFLFNVPGIREGYDALKMLIPGIGKVTRTFALSKFARSFAALYRAGFSMSACLRISGEACGNAVIRHVTRTAILRAEQGEQVSGVLAKSYVFPSLAIDMFRTGETSGNLDEMLDHLANFYEEEGKLKAHQIAMYVSVAVGILVGIMVGASVIQQYQGYGQAISAAANEN